MGNGRGNGNGAGGDAGALQLWDAGRELKSIKEQLRQIPGRGMGYGVLRYVGEPGVRRKLAAMPRAEVRFNVADSPSLGPRQRARLLERLGPVVRVAASDERSQARNRALALERLRSRLAEALRVQRERRPTAPTTASQQRRLESKRRRVPRDHS